MTYKRVSGRNLRISRAGRAILDPEVPQVRRESVWP